MLAIQQSNNLDIQKSFPEALEVHDAYLDSLSTMYSNNYDPSLQQLYRSFLDLCSQYGSLQDDSLSPSAVLSLGKLADQETGLA